MDDELLMTEDNRTLLRKLVRTHFEGKPYRVWKEGGLCAERYANGGLRIPEVMSATQFQRIYNGENPKSQHGRACMTALAAACLGRGVLVPELLEWYNKDDLRRHAAQAFDLATEHAFDLTFRDTVNSSVGSFKVTRNQDKVVMLELVDWEVVTSFQDTKAAPEALEGTPKPE